jgi:hypothetical protein
MIKKGSISRENQELSDKIMLGFRLAYEKLVKEAALHGESLVFGKNGENHLRTCGRASQRY